MTLKNTEYNSKECSTCSGEFPLTSFPKTRRNHKYVYRPQCRTCYTSYQKLQYDLNQEQRRAKGRAYYARDKATVIDRQRWYKRASQYGVTKEQFYGMWDAQQGLCKLCEKELTISCCVDHDHTNGNVRGLLCNSCNRGIGLLQEDPRLLEKAMNYIKKYRDPEEH